MRNQRPATARLLAIAYYPTMVWCGLLVVVAALLLGGKLILPDTGWRLAAVGAAMCVPLFLTLLLDRRTRDAVNEVPRRLGEQWPNLTLREKFFAPGFGEPFLLILNRLALLECVIAQFAHNGPATMVAFVSFALSCVLSFLLIGHPRPFRRSEGDG
jgi:hypothetical protein